METIDELKQSRDTWEDIAQNCRKDLEQQVERIVELKAENNKIKNTNFKLMEKCLAMEKHLEQLHEGLRGIYNLCNNGNPTHISIRRVAHDLLH